MEKPNLYDIRVTLRENGVQKDVYEESFGFRKVEFKADGFYLNDRKFKLRGLNRHQSYPYVGYAMPASMQIRDAEILKYELGLNAVRTSHYPQSHDFIRRCDEIGLLVFTEIPGWQHIGDEAWKDQAVANVTEMVVQYRNHPSIFLWGVRINESKDDDALYTRTNAEAHRLDSTRQTGGVRCYKRSSLLEDVYTYNDFVHNGKNEGVEQKKYITPDMSKAYFVSEYNGHMFPTKSFDNEDHRLEHALRHATVLNAVNSYDDIAGSFGWCMADYNTHKDFGAGDRICYHGVLDMVRNPKMAASVYASQSDRGVVLEVSSSMDIGEHPAGIRQAVYIFTNADSVRMYRNDVFIHEYVPEKSEYKNLKHGPILVDDYVGDQLETVEGFPKKQAEDIKKVLLAAAKYTINDLPKSVMMTAGKLMVVNKMTMEQAYELYEKYIGGWGDTVTTFRFEAVKDGHVVKTVIKAPNREVHFTIEPSKTALTEEKSYDVAALRIRAVDENDNVLPYYCEPVQFTCEGDIELIGPATSVFRGGTCGTYIRTKPGKGSGSGRMVITFADGSHWEQTFTCTYAE